VAVAVADVLADALGRAVADRGSGVVVLSGGATPREMYRRLALADLDWRRVHVVQVDERLAPDGHPDRNWPAVEGLLVGPTGAVGHPMPVADGDPDAGASAYARLLGDLCGGALDVVHLGLGADGHTASLVPGDPVLDVADRDVALTGAYRGRRRMTLTFPAIDRAAAVVWQVAGEGKREALERLLAGDPALPAGRVRRGADVRVHADAAALGRAGPG
jgi:6-phosphogluconolactonase